MHFSKFNQKKKQAKQQQQQQQQQKGWSDWNSLSRGKCAFSLVSCARKGQPYSQKIRGTGMALVPFKLKLLNYEEKQLFVGGWYQLVLRGSQPMRDVPNHNIVNDEDSLYKFFRKQ